MYLAVAAVGEMPLHILQACHLASIQLQYHRIPSDRAVKHIARVDDAWRRGGDRVGVGELEAQGLDHGAADTQAALRRERMEIIHPQCHLRTDALLRLRPTSIRW